VKSRYICIDAPRGIVGLIQFFADESAKRCGRIKDWELCMVKHVPLIGNDQVKIIWHELASAGLRRVAGRKEETPDANSSGWLERPG
jgi:hypothetical protein